MSETRQSDEAFLRRALSGGFAWRSYELTKVGVKQLPRMDMSKVTPLVEKVREVRAHYEALGMPALAELHFLRAGRQLCDLACAAAGVEIPPALSAPPALAAPEVKGELSPNVPLEAEVARAREKLSPGQRSLLAEFNLRVNLGRRLEDFEPKTAKIAARGYDNNLTMDHGPAFFTPWKNVITMLQEHKYYYADDIYVHSFNPYFYFLHECGHALSQACREISEWPLLAEAYAKDLKGLENLLPGPVKPEPWERKVVNADTLETATGHPQRCPDEYSAGRRYNLRYYIDKDEGGAQWGPRAARSEVVAELFAVLTSGTQRPDHQMLQTFPESAAVLKKILGALEEEMTAPLDVTPYLSNAWREAVVKPRPVPPPANGNDSGAAEAPPPAKQPQIKPPQP
jgi:hypothetical protein